MAKFANFCQHNNAVSFSDKWQPDLKKRFYEQAYKKKKAEIKTRARGQVLNLESNFKT